MGPAQKWSSWKWSSWSSWKWSSWKLTRVPPGSGHGSGPGYPHHGSWPGYPPQKWSSWKWSSWKLTRVPPRSGHRGSGHHGSWPGYPPSWKWTRVPPRSGHHGSGHLGRLTRVPPPPPDRPHICHLLYINWQVGSFPLKKGFILVLEIKLKFKVFFIVMKGIGGYTISIIFPQYCAKYRVSRSHDYTQTLLSIISKQEVHTEHAQCTKLLHFLSKP